MDTNNEIEDLEFLSEDDEIDESTSVDDFIKELEAKEKDLHITAETTFIELAADFEDGELPDYLKQDFSEDGRKTVEPSTPDTELSDPTSAVNLENEVLNLETEVLSLRSKISTLETERSEMFENSQRRSKDFEAYKKRTERERGETFQKQLGNLAAKMLPAIDNLDRALKFASDMPDAKRDEFASFFEGIVLVNQEVNEVLDAMGIQPIATVGETFDPHLHEAVAIEQSSDFPQNTISAELLRGYRIGEKVIRHSMVKVANPPAQAGARPQSEEGYGHGDTEGSTEAGLTTERSGMSNGTEEIEPAEEVDQEMSG